MRWLALSLAVIGATGCSGGSVASSGTGTATGSTATGSTSAGSTGGNPSAACATYASALCAFLSQCEPEDLVVDYGSSSGCETEQTSLCLTNVAAPGAGITTSWLSACGTSYTSQAGACASGPVPIAVPTPGDACAVTGAGAAGSACGINDQCQSDSCVRSGSLCGVCTSVVNAGATCGGSSGASCARGLVCGANGVCLTEVGIDAGCDGDVTTTCQTGASCVLASKDATQGACLANGTKAGTACNTDGIGQPKCSEVGGFYCDPQNQCAAYSFLDGGACGEVKDAGLPGGAEYSFCVDALCVDKTCQAPGAAGSACVYEQDPGCRSGTTCVTADPVDGGAGNCTPNSLTCAPAGTTGGSTSGGGGQGTTSGGSGGGAAGLWINGNLAFNASALSASGSPPDSINCGLTAAEASAVDGQGDLWATAGALSNVNVWTPAELAAGCYPGASITMTYDPTDNLIFSAIAFDSAGNLWGVGSDSNTAGPPVIWGFKASDLTASGNITPTWMATGSSNTPADKALYQYAPPAMAFDSAGSLWVANSFTVIAFKSATLMGWTGASNTATPDMEITTSGALSYFAKPDKVSPPETTYQSLAFDGAGNLWIGFNYEPSDSKAPNRGQILEIAKADLGSLSTNDTPTPTSTITWPSSASQGGYGPLAFDASGNLWATYWDGTSKKGNLVRYPGASGTSDVTIDWVESAGSGVATTLAFNPIPAGLPINP